MSSRLLLFAVWACGLTACYSQAPDCKKYFECAEALSPGSSAYLDPTYGETGTCWTTNAAAADACALACKQALAKALENPNAPEQCRR
jgi:hypothetical protein